MGKGLKMYPLTAICRPRWNGNVMEIVTKERINKELVLDYIPEEPNKPMSDENSSNYEDEVDVYTCHKRKQPLHMVSRGRG